MVQDVEKIHAGEERLDHSYGTEFKGSDYDSQDGTEGFTPAEQKAIIHRIDRRLVLTTGFMYCISLMDRTNLPAAVIAG